jgi:crotonobetainyl-CoA:carnitine CoA-transferase CaiB-like acyl-CoA transferase
LTGPRRWWSNTRGAAGTLGFRRCRFFGPDVRPARRSPPARGRGTLPDRLVAPEDLPLSGVRVADFSRVLAGPLATMVLADLGADVVKVERPEVGDDTRGWGPPFVGDDAAYFLALNRNKRSVVLDLSAETGRAAARRLALASDVVVENFRPGLMRRFGLGADELLAEKPALVYCSMTAFGDGAEDASRPGYDIIVQALSGLMSFTGQPGGEPTKVGVALLDVICGLYAAIAIQSGLLGVRATGRGGVVGVSLFDASVAALVNQAANHLLGGLVPGPMGSAHPNIVPYQLFHAADRPFILAAGNDRLFERACRVIERPELAADERFATNEARVGHRDELIPILETAFAARDADAWLGMLEAAAVPCAPVRTLDEVFASPEGAAAVQEIVDAARGPLRLVADPIRIDGSIPPVRRPPPRLGEHSEEILREVDG